MSKKLIINHCYECPHLEIINNKWCCEQTTDDRRLTDAEIIHIPVWCPLPNE